MRGDTIDYKNYLVNQQGEMGPEPPRPVSLTRAFFENNFFYALSACLMMLGCYLLMRSPVIEGPVFTKTLASLTILQAYEILVIATAMLIVRHFLRLGDAFSLLVIELVLLLDPTFFSNSFLTMIPTLGDRGPLAVNAVCLALVPVKLALLQWGLRLRFTPRLWLGILAAAAVVYFGTTPLNYEVKLLSREAIFYCLSWKTVIVCAILPAAWNCLTTVAGTTDDYMSPRQALALQRLLVVIPVAIVAMHFIESSVVFGIQFYWFYGAPLLLAVAVMAWNQWRPGANADPLFQLSDVLSVFAVLISFSYPNIEGKAAMGVTRVRVPEFLVAGWPVVFVGLGIVALYAVVYLRTQFPKALVRVGILCAGAVGYGIYKTGIIGKTWNLILSPFRFLGEMFSRLSAVFSSQPTVALLIVTIVFVVLAWRKRTFITWLFAGLSMILLGFAVSTESLLSWSPEIAQCVFAWLVILSHRFGDSGRNRYTAATAMIIFALGRFMYEPVIWTGTVMITEAVALMILGYKVRERAYIILGLLQLAAIVGFSIHASSAWVNPAITTLAMGLALFAIGVLVTFQKQRILKWVAERPPESDAISWVGRREAEPVESPDVHDAPSRVSQPFGTEFTVAPVTPMASETVEPLAPYVPAKPPPSPAGEVDADAENLPEFTARILRCLFIHDPVHGILVSSAVEKWCTPELVAAAGLDPGETIEAYFPVMIIDQTARGVALTPKRIIFVYSKGRPNVSVAYDQIARVTRNLSSLLLIGHTDQKFMFSELNQYQLVPLGVGLEKLLMEIAFG
ncbi:MAG: hypothetical protein K1X53_17455 [Candidatus Sumerlaeaceae bacterium]|nr:hypothetical protein [Candidatus Sumerlaeaceae bacterium]